MRRDLVNETSQLLGIKNKEMIEKDAILHEILADLSKDKFFSDNFAFKGGTCLVKSHLGYFRFSEDVDFTWKKQDVFEKKSHKKIRSYLSDVINKTGKVFEGISQKRGLDFKCVKSNADYVELGGSNKFCTFKLWFDSEFRQRSFIKVQINFVEKLYFPFKKKRLKSLVSNNKKKLEEMFPEHKEYFNTIGFEVYDVKEILCEKIRAILTRRGTKARDFVDVYLISKQMGIKPSNMEEQIIGKTIFTLELYDKYRKNLKNKTKLLESGRFFDWGYEKGLLILKLDEKDFYVFLNQLQKFLKEIAQRINSK